MKKKRNLMFGLLLLFVLLAGVCAQAEETQEAGSEIYTIGVVVYNPESTEMSMFMNYYQNYLEEGFPVKFYFSGEVYTAQEENAFIEAMKEQGAKGIISFSGTDLPNTLKVCEENEMYYVLGSGIVRDAVYEEVKDNPWFLGSVGPKLEEVYQSGCNMASYFLEQGAKNFIIMSGGSSSENALHAARTVGMLDVLREQAGLVLDGEAEEVAVADENTRLTSGDGSVTVTICPGYTEGGAGLENLKAAFAEGQYDALMSAFHTSTYLDVIAGKEKEQNADIMVGAIDSFTEENFQAVQQEDIFGNPPINYVEGKYASMAGPAFAMLYNAITGHPETNTPDGKAVRLYQGFWKAIGRKEYMELYSYTSGIYENAYSCEDLMKVIKVFNEDASPQEVAELAEAYTVEDVKGRILGE